MKTIYELLPERLAAIRNERNLTQQEAADLCGMPLRTYASIEYGDSFPRKERFERLCSAFGVTSDYFVSQGAVIEKEHGIEECVRRVSSAALRENVTPLFEAPSKNLQYIAELEKKMSPQFFKIVMKGIEINAKAWASQFKKQEDQADEKLPADRKIKNRA